MSESRQQFIPMTITECVRELSKLVPGAEIGFISATSRVTWIRPSQHDDENNWNEIFIVCVENRLRRLCPKHTKQHESISGGLMDDKGEKL